MKKLIIILVMLFTSVTYAQKIVHKQEVKLEVVPPSTIVDTILIYGANQSIQHISYTDMINKISADISTGQTDLGYVASPTNGVITNNNGTDATIPVVDITNAGLATSNMLSQISTNDSNATAAKAKTDHITVTQSVDLDQMESDVASNNSKVSNATHTGDVTGSTVLSISNDAVDINHLSATGTPNSNTALFGDNTWKTIPNSYNPNDQYNINANYTTLDANNHMKGIVLGGNITLDDAGLTAGYDQTFVNNSSVDVTIDLAAGQNTLNGQASTFTIPQGFYAYVELIADNVWSVIVGSEGAAELQVHNVDSNYTPSQDENQNMVYASGGTTLTLDDSSLNVGFNQTFYNSTGGDITISSADNIEGGTTIPDGTWAAYVLQSSGNWVVSVQTEGGGSTDLGYTASPSNGVVTSSTGNDATIPLGNGTNAGLISPTVYTQVSQNESDITNIKGKTDYITVTQSVDLDQLGSNLNIEGVKYPIRIFQDTLSIEKNLTDYFTQLWVRGTTDDNSGSLGVAGADGSNSWITYVDVNNGGLITNVNGDDWIIHTSSGKAKFQDAVEIERLVLNNQWFNEDGSVVTKLIGDGRYAQLSNDNVFTGQVTINHGLGNTLETNQESPSTSGVYLLGAPNNMSGHVLNTDGSVVDNGELVANIATTENLYALGFEPENTTNFSVATTSVENNKWYEVNHATTDITITLDQGVKGRVAYFEQTGDAQGIFTAGSGVILTHTLSVTTPKTREKGAVVAAIWKTATKVHLVGGLEDN